MAFVVKDVQKAYCLQFGHRFLRFDKILRRKLRLALPNNLESLRNYFAQISLVDHNVGRILETLDRLDMRRDTIIIYTSDHGFSLGHNGVWGHGAAAFPASAHRPSYHIPLLISGAGVKADHVNRDLVSQLDLFPTIASFAGLEEVVPSLPSSASDLKPLLGGGIRTGGEVYYEQEETRAIRTEDWLYVKRFKGAKSFCMCDELYDLKADPSEKQNVIDDTDLEEVRKSLDGKIGGFFTSYVDPKYDLWSGGSAKSNVTYKSLWVDAWADDWRPLLGSELQK